MRKKYKNILVVLITLVLALGISVGVWYHLSRRPYQMFEKLFGFELPETADVLRWTIPTNKTWDLAAKISFQEEDLSYFITNFHVFMTPYGELAIEKEREIPNLSSYIPWWDLNKSDMLYGWRFVTKGKVLHLEEGWAQHRSRWGNIVITKDQNNQYLVYVSY